MVIGAKYRQAVVLIVRPLAGGILFCSRALGCEVFRGREGMSERRVARFASAAPY